MSSWVILPNSVCPYAKHIIFHPQTCASSVSLYWRITAPSTVISCQDPRNTSSWLHSFSPLQAAGDCWLTSVESAFLTSLISSPPFQPGSYCFICKPPPPFAWTVAVVSWPVCFPLVQLPPSSVIVLFPRSHSDHVAPLFAIVYRIKALKIC